MSVLHMRTLIEGFPQLFLCYVLFFLTVHHMRTVMEGFPVFFLCSFLFSIFILSIAVDTINSTQSIRDGETIVSAGEWFELGFFSPGNSNQRYLGIWYKKISIFTVVWVANRATPILDSSGVLRVTDLGTLVLLNQTNGIIWSSNSLRSSHSPVAQLLDTGNFVVRDRNYDNPENILWQSFDHPCDTLLPGMKFGMNRITGQEWYLSSWKSIDDPSKGDFTFRADPNRFSQYVMSKNSVVQARTGPWNGLGFNGEPALKTNSFFNFDYIVNQNEMYYIYRVLNVSVLARSVLSPAGLLKRFIWVNGTEGWALYKSLAMDNCKRYGVCGPYGTCNVNNFPLCECLEGFVPKSPKDWDMVDWASGCVRETPLDCQNGDGFLKYSGVKLPDTKNYWHNGSMNLEECKKVCLKNCSCTAYANSDARRGGSGCLIWFGDLIDMRDNVDNGQDIYIRMAASELHKGDNVKLNDNSPVKKGVKIIVSSVVVTGMLLGGLPLLLYVCWKKLQQRDGKMTERENLELPLFDLATIANATDNFSFHNKIGEGGFGPVYKGVFKDRQEIAVKRLSKSSKQGLDEFQNEVMYIAKLQHRNLVKLLGCCIQVDEMMLVYEYMPNNSLDSLIFDQTKSIILDWPKRFRIINGIARGLLYLHQDSRLRIIHRDLKASNILLDKEMNPKISDFGMARSFVGNETKANTRRVAGTYGYMSPEYAVDGLYSVQSDVFSFGVLVLEIVSGKRNRGFHHPDHHLNLLGHAWRLYREDRPLELVDSSLANSCNPSEVLRSIHLGLLCVQRRQEDRPSMSSVVIMLGGEGGFPPPKQPGFFNERDPFEVDSSSSGKNEQPCSANKISMTLLDAR